MSNDTIHGGQASMRCNMSIAITTLLEVYAVQAGDAVSWQWSTAYLRLFRRGPMDALVCACDLVLFVSGEGNHQGFIQALAKRFGDFFVTVACSRGFGTTHWRSCSGFLRAFGPRISLALQRAQRVVERDV